MGCESCRNHEAEDIAGATKEARLMSDMVQAYDRQNRRLWVTVLALAGTLAITAGCMVWAVLNAQNLANEAMLNALNSVAEIGVTEDPPAFMNLSYEKSKNYDYSLGTCRGDF